MDFQLSRRYLRILVTIVATLATPSQAHWSWPQLRTSAPVCEKLYQQIRDNNFVTGRILAEYFSLLGSEFAADLKALKAGQHWMDLGAGEAFAVEQYLRSRGFDPFTQSLKLAQGNVLTYPTGDLHEILNLPYSLKANVTAVSYTVERTDLPTHFDKFRVLRGDLFETIPASILGRVDLASDVFGVAAYTAHPDLYFRKLFDQLSDGGRAYILINDYNPSASLNKTLFRTLDGKTIPFSEWVQRIPGIEARWSEDGLRIQIHDRSQIRVPSVELIKTDDGRPPRRIFRETPIPVR